MSWWRDVCELALPLTCVACGAGGEEVCARCWTAMDLHPRAHLPSPRPAGLPVITVAGWYDGPLRTLILAMKERDQRAVARVLGRVLALALPADVGEVVTVPASRRSLRQRGADVLADTVDHALADFPGGARRIECLRLVGQPADQAGLDAAARSRNLAGSLAVRARPLGPVVLVDDVVTTGATLAEAVRALGAAGVPLRAVVALAGRRRHPR